MPCNRMCSKCFLMLNLLNPHSNPLRQKVLTSSKVNISTPPK